MRCAATWASSRDLDGAAGDQFSILAANHHQVRDGQTFRDGIDAVGRQERSRRSDHSPRSRARRGTVEGFGRVEDGASRSRRLPSTPIFMAGRLAPERADVFELGANRVTGYVRYVGHEASSWQR